MFTFRLTTRAYSISRNILKELSADLNEVYSLSRANLMWNKPILGKKDKFVFELN
jgi:hypothetical protein